MNSAVRIGTVSADGGDRRWVQAPGDPRDGYLARMDWIDAETLAIQQLNRLQNQDDFLLADVRNGSVTRVFRDESRAWVDVVNNVRWIDDGRAFLWISERDGWKHVFRVPRGGGAASPITRFDADVIDVVGTDGVQGWLYFLASPANATERYLYRSKLDGSGTPERVTPASQPGTHVYDLAPGGRLAFHTWSQFDRTPVMVDVVELPSHRPLRTLIDSSALAKKLSSVLAPPVEFFTIDIGGGVALDGWMLKPQSFDPSRKYPVIVYVYGEPAAQTVTNRWGGVGMLFHRALVEAGYIIVSFDNRGTPAPKGRAWRQVVYGAMAIWRVRNRPRPFGRSKRDMDSSTRIASVSGGRPRQACARLAARCELARSTSGAKTRWRGPAASVPSTRKATGAHPTLTSRFTGDRRTPTDAGFVRLAPPACFSGRCSRCRQPSAGLTPLLPATRIAIAREKGDFRRAVSSTSSDCSQQETGGASVAPDI